MRLITLFPLLPLLCLSAFTHAQDYSLEAPDQVHIREKLSVTWQAPQDDGGLLEIRPLDEGGRRIAYSYVRQNPAAIEAPEQPGDYRLVYVYQGQVQASAPLRVVMAQASVSAPDSARAGESIEVSWRGPASRNDQITWAQRDGDFIRGSSYGYVQNEAGSRRIRAPADAGDYDIIYRSGSTILARHPISIGSIAATLTAPARIHAGGSIEVAFTGPDNDGDRITFAERDGEVRRDIGSYSYVGTARGNALTLRVGETPGDYDVVYLSNGRVIGRSPIEIVPATVEISAPGEVQTQLRFTVAWSGAGNTGDRIFVADADGREHDYAYVDPGASSVELIAPRTAAEYSVVYQTRGGRVMDREALQVVAAPQPPGELTVTATRTALATEDAVEIILDASGSMLQRLGDDRRIDIAKRTLIDLVTDTIPPDTGFALRVFGHREADSCRSDLEIPLAPLAPPAVAATIAGINAMNLARTPIGASIAHARSDLADVTGQRMLIVLTDGEETCDGDAAGEIAALRDLGWDIRTNIVGFAIDDAALVRTFEGWAAAGGGQYFSAGNADDLARAMTRAVASRFEVADEQDRIVANGSTAGDPITLPAGDYRIVSPAGTRNVTIRSGQTTTVEL